ncbi:PQQ-binding-like beta-propeller repeat protein [Microlunatus speluncae]|uniref:outer membrane protein assembly factor BamB family protein n=1 Tax=Microlunatus speluncae TaxID=2594267 RepID=UPI0012663631|nr:PQQ-binding-like beta-propeller repeat protein [Microlunatus speluncae]
MTKDNRRRALDRLVLPIVIGLALSGCALLSTDPEYGGPPAPELRLEKIWDSGASGIEHASYALVLGETVVLTEVPTESDKRPGRTEQSVAAVDAATGELRWRVDHDTPLAPVIAGTGLTRARPDVEYFYNHDSRGGAAKAAGGIVAVPYSQAASAAPGEGYTDGWAIVGLSLADGKPRWAYPAIPQLPVGDPRARPDTLAKVVAVTGSAVVINLEAPGGGFADSDGAGRPATTIALDSQTGTELWSTDDLLALAAVDDSIIARSDSGDQAGRPVVLDARTGKTRWTGAGPAYLAAVCDTHAVFVADGSGYEAVELRTSASTKIKATGRLVCDHGMLAWLTDSDLRTRVISTEQTERGAVDLDPGSEVHIKVEVEAAVNGYLWGAEWYELSPTEHPDEWITFALDRTGAKRARLPGRHLLAVSDRFLVATTAGQSDDGHPFEVYKIN